jgi:hypothetical protein
VGLRLSEPGRRPPPPGGEPASARPAARQPSESPGTHPTARAGISRNTGLEPCQARDPRAGFKLRGSPPPAVGWKMPGGEGGARAARGVSWPGSG